MMGKEVTKLVIFGLGEIAELLYYFVSNGKKYEISAFTVDREYINSNTFYDKPIVPFEEVEYLYPPEEHKMFVAVGYKDVNNIREEKYLQAKKKKYELITYIHPKATVAKNVLVGDNCFVFEDNTIQPFVTIEENCILWSGNHIGHHTKIHKNSFITSHVVISGGVEIGKNSFIGVNATIRDHIKIGKSNVIGAGALIMKDTEDKQVFITKQTEPTRMTSDKLGGI